MTTPRNAARPTASPPAADVVASAAGAAEPEAALAAVEQAIATLGHALTLKDAAAVEAAADALQSTMRAALERFAQLARRGRMPQALRRRVALAAARVAAQREAVNRAATVFDQGLEILLPPRSPAATSVYSPAGATGRGPGRMLAAS